MEVKYGLKWYLMRWFVQLVRLVDSIIGSLTLGFYCPDWSLWAEAKYLDMIFPVKK